jgi:murein DD-endopeptidase MepM/ murein hydrolase activator NlpD
VTIAPPALPLPIVPQAQAVARPREHRDPREVARDLEALLVTQMIAAMRRTVPTGGMLEPSAARRTLDGAFDHELARALVQGEGLGIARQIEQAMALGRSGRAQASLPAPGAGGETFLPTPSAGRAVHAESRASAAEARAGAEFAVPVEGRLTSEFGIRRDPFTGDDDFHAGVDLAAPRGTPIRVAADGEVVFSGRRGASGNVVVVRHAGGVTTSYAHAERALAVAGQEVVAGDVIATVGSSGRATGPHLHFAARRNGQLIDPQELLPELGEGSGRG